MASKHFFSKLKLICLACLLLSTVFAPTDMLFAANDAPPGVICNTRYCEIKKAVTDKAKTGGNKLINAGKTVTQKVKDAAAKAKSKLTKQPAETTSGRSTTAADKKEDDKTGASGTTASQPVVPTSAGGPSTGPVSAYTSTGKSYNNIGSFVTDILLNYATKAAFVAALLMIVYAGFRYTISGGSSDAMGTSKELIIGALLGLATIYLIGFGLKFVLPEDEINSSGEIGTLSSSGGNNNLDFSGISQTPTATNTPSTEAIVTNQMFPVAVSGNPKFGNDWLASRGDHKHAGNDIVAPRGTPVIAVADGKIERFGKDQRGFNSEPINRADPIYKFTLTPSSANGQKYYYAHVIKPNVDNGSVVKKGQVIAYVGTANNVHHLHFGIKVTSQTGAYSYAGNYWINPNSFLKKINCKKTADIQELNESAAIKIGRLLGISSMADEVTSVDKGVDDFPDDDLAPGQSYENFPREPLICELGDSTDDQLQTIAPTDKDGIIVLSAQEPIDMPEDPPVDHDDREEDCATAESPSMLQKIAGALKINSNAAEAFCSYGTYTQSTRTTPVKPPGCKNYVVSESRAKDNLTTIKFKSWYLDGNKKSTRNRSLTIHKCAATSAKKALDAIYADPEKFPINQISAVNWRCKRRAGRSENWCNGNPPDMSHHSYGIAIDINQDQNDLYKPSKPNPALTSTNPITRAKAIKAKGSVVKNFEGQGWKWGGNWKKSKDYMHISVNGQ